MNVCMYTRATTSIWISVKILIFGFSNYLTCALYSVQLEVNLFTCTCWF